MLRANSQVNKKRANATPKKTSLKVPKRALTTKRTKNRSLTTSNIQSTSKSIKLTSPLTFSKRTIVHQLDTPASAEKFIQDNKVVVIDFYADWCGPCKALKPKFEGMSNEFTNVQFGKVNADEFSTPDINDAFPPVTALPTVIFFQAGKPAEMVVGMNEAKIRSTLAAYQNKTAV